MEMYHNTVQDSSGNIVNGATITVFDAGTGTPSTIYDKDGVSQSNPFLSGLNRSEGEIEFAAANGMYDVKIESGASIDWVYAVQLYDADDIDAALAGKQPLDATLTALAGTLTTANKIPYATATDAAGELDFKDEDNMASNSATAVPSQQSVKAYVDSMGALDGHIDGLLWSNNGVDAVNDFDVSAGECTSSDGTTLLTLASAQTKRMDAAWATGTNAGALATGATAWAAGVSYHVFVGLISGTVEIIVDSDPAAANAITNNGLGAHRHIFSFLTDTGPALPTLHTALVGRNVRAMLDVMALDVSNTGSTEGAFVTLSVPTGIQVLATLGYRIVSVTGGANALVTETAQTNSAASISLLDVRVNADATQAQAELTRMTDTSGRVRYRSDVALLVNVIFTRAYEFRR